MTHDRGQIVEKFLRARRTLSEAGKAAEREKLDETLREIAVVDPDVALAIMRELSLSDDFTARETAAIFSRYLFPARGEQVAAMLVGLLNDTDPDIARQALTTIDELTGDPELTADQAARRIKEITTNDGRA